ncbi:Uncharacterised protein [[Clostridium] sordellii]|nr:hypothetical protein [Paeniclostridium sordellii]CEQ01651.1 Uncharacterised protein [[Clostridium] sordellii] [Paeniclostridium sordellii]
MKLDILKILKIIMYILGALTIIKTCMGGLSIFTQIAWIIVALMGVNNW